ncbi:hypothetical protein ACLOJK_032100 [Asimina triloba]
MASLLPSVKTSLPLATHLSPPSSRDLKLQICTLRPSVSPYSCLPLADYQRRGDPLYVLLCYWAAVVGASLVKPEDILEGVASLRISSDIEFEE